MKYQVVGGGLAGLTASIALARDGAEVDLFEHRHELGGRGISTDDAGCRVNLGPHALYKNGTTITTLKSWGIELVGGSPALKGTAYFVRDGERYPLPTGFAGVALTQLLSLGEKLEFASAYAKMTGDAPHKAAGLSVAQWLDAHTKTTAVRQILESLIRLSTYANEPAALSMEATQHQLALSAGGVVYLDGGWQQMIDKLAQAARDAGVRIHLGKTIESLKPGTILAISPTEVCALTHVAIPARPIRAAAFDLVLNGLPDGAAHFALGLDQPLYFSVHSQWAQLGPAGTAVIHAAKYLAEGESANRHELERWCDIVMPGWDDRVRHSRFFPNLTVSHAIPCVVPRPAVDSLRIPGVAIAGDWVGPKGMLGDAAVASALAAASWLMHRQL